MGFPNAHSIEQAHSLFQGYAAPHRLEAEPHGCHSLLQVRKVCKLVSRI
ncbi:hypothetical protein R2A130_0289 [Ahrensia sp. R2A130]|nr:hypothetical protein R2A130_0289 [Ahrensia sp. R2A130]